MLNFNPSIILPSEKITKRVILYFAQKFFDPIGIIWLTLLYPKLLMQNLWSYKIDWDTKVDIETQKSFLSWHKELILLKNLKIPRWLFNNVNKIILVSLNIFTDARKDAIASVIFSSIETLQEVIDKLVTAKSRVSPKDRSTTPRLELLASTIGTRLMSFAQ